MTTKNTLFLMPLIIFTMGCSRTFYYDNETKEKYVKEFAVDSTCMVYQRKLYTIKDENSNHFKDLTIDTDNTVLAEIQYLIIHSNNDALYISTLPSKYPEDKTGTYLLKSGYKNSKPFYPNSFFFSTFYFGKFNPADSTLLFSSRKAMQVWNLKITQEKKEVKVRGVMKKKRNVDFVSMTKFHIKKRRNELKKIVSDKIFASNQQITLSVKNPIHFEQNVYFKYLSFKVPGAKEKDEEKELKSNKEKDSLSNLTIMAQPIRIVYKDEALKKIDYLEIPYNKDVYEKNNSIRFRKGNVIFDKQ